MKQADHFMRAMSTLDEFSKREIFVSLSPDNGSQRCEIAFKDDSVVYNDWCVEDGELLIKEGVVKL